MFDQFPLSLAVPTPSANVERLASYRPSRRLVLDLDYTQPDQLFCKTDSLGSTADMDNYSIIYTTPSVEDYISLRTLTGLSPKTAQAATVGLANTLFAVQIAYSVPQTGQTTIVGMGRMIGDGGCFFQIVDIAVLPSHQHKGLAKMIMSGLKHWMDKNIPESGTVLLFADGRANELYKQFGFVETSGLTPSSVGMACRY